MDYQFTYQIPAKVENGGINPLILGENKISKLLLLNNRVFNQYENRGFDLGFFVNNDVRLTIDIQNTNWSFDSACFSINTTKSCSFNDVTIILHLLYLLVMLLICCYNDCKTYHKGEDDEKF